MSEKKKTRNVTYNSEYIFFVEFQIKIFGHIPVDE